jgi:hypothetical protein
MDDRPVPTVRSALIAVLAALAAVPALAQETEPPRSIDVQLDDDAPLESLGEELVRDRYGYAQRRPFVADDCEDGVGHRWFLGPRRDSVAVLEARELDGVAERREILVEGRSGAAGRAGYTKVWRHNSVAGVCAAPRALFSYVSGAPSPRPPRGYYVANYGVTVRRDRSLRLFESLARNSEPAIAARRQRVSVWRYSPSRDRFTRRSSRVSRIR